jgi:hypothetical protein
VDPVRRPEQAPAVLALHGAGFGISANLSRIMKLRDEGFGAGARLPAGRSDGDLPSEDSAYEDAEAAWSNSRRAPAARASSTATRWAARSRSNSRNASARMPRARRREFVHQRAEMQQYSAYKWIPLAAIQTQFFDALAKAPKLCVPTLFMHGTADYRIPVEVAKKLYDAAPGPKRWLLVEGARHVDIPTRYTAQWSTALRELRDLAGTPRAACRA